MSSTIFPKKVESFYERGDHYLGNKPIFNPFMLLDAENLSGYQSLYRQYPLLNYGMSYPGNLPPEDQPMTVEDRFLGQVRLL